MSEREQERDPFIRNALRSYRVPPRSADFTQKLIERCEDTADTNESSMPKIGTKRRSRSSRSSLRRTAPMFAAAAIVLVVCLVGIAKLMADKNDAPPIARPEQSLQPLLASDVVAKATAAYTSIESLSGTVEIVANDGYYDESRNTPGASSTKFDFRLKADGTLWTSTQFDSYKQLQSYDPATATGIYCVMFASDTRWRCEHRRRITPLDIVATFPSTDTTLLSTTVLDLVEDASTKVEDTELDGRPAWKLSVALTPTEYTDVDAATIYVDQASGFPLQTTISSKGTIDREVRVSNLTVDPNLSVDQYVVDLPSPMIMGPDVDFTYDITTLQDAAKRSGHSVYTPSDSLAGYTLSQVQYTGDRLDHDHNVMVTYRRGIEKFTVQTRDRMKDDTATNDARLALENIGKPKSFQEIDRRLTGGVLSGRGAHIVQAMDGNSLRVLLDNVVVTISGDVGINEMWQMADSLTG